MKNSSLFILITLLTYGCMKAPKVPETCSFSTDTSNYFSIQDNSDSPGRAYNVFCKKVLVFGISIYATCEVSDEDLLHAANVMAQYLDNDENEIVDNPLVLEKMLEAKSALTLFGKENSKRQRRFFNTNGDDYSPESAQDLYGTETFPGWNKTLPFDATLEEVLHLVTAKGYSIAYPSVFGETQGSELANAMDLARGGQFNDIPSSYPEGSWYSYDDKTCDYQCQVTEYLYWALTSLLGAQDFPGRYNEISHEWRANTTALLESMDPSVFSLLTDSTYKLPTTLPDGSYRQ
jgi:hypothetical protein